MMSMAWVTGDNIMRYIIIIFLLLLNSSCYEYKPKTGGLWAQELLTKGPKDASTTFKKGWIDGCETGISAAANSFQTYFYRWKQDAELAQTDEYYTGWRLAFYYCARYTYQYSRRHLI